MISLIKIIILFLCLSSCSIINTGYFGIFYENFKSDDLGSLEDLKAAIPYSFIKVSQGKRKATFVLSHIDKNDIEYWIGASQEQLVIVNGAIIKTLGLESDFQVYKKDWNKISKRHLKDNYSSSISFKNPDLRVAELTNSFTDGTATKGCAKSVLNLKEIRSIGFKKEDTYCLDTSGIVISTKQHVFPLSKDPLEIEFHYQY